MPSFRRALGPAALTILAACAHPAGRAESSSMQKPAVSETLLFSAEANARILTALGRPGCVWVTDADGTLWREDIGEGFLRQLIADKALVSPEATGDVWATYEAKVAADKTRGYAWAAQVMAGMDEQDLEARARRYAEGFVSAHLRPEMKALLQEAHAAGCETYIVSASNEWIIRAAAPLLGLPVEHGMGIRVAVQDGKLTDTLVGPVTNQAGKVQAIRERIGKTPQIVSGDSGGDYDMLSIATDAPLYLVHKGAPDEALLGRARAGKWLLESVAP